MFSAAATVSPATSFNASGASTLSVNITAPQQNSYLPTSYAMITWDAVDTEHVISYYLVYLDSLSEPCASTDQNEVNLTGLTDGMHAIVVRAFNNVGGVAEDSVLFFIDTVPPALSIISPVSNTYLNSSNVTVTWQAADSANIAYFEAQLDSDPPIAPIAYNKTSHTFSGLINGPHAITVIAHGWGGRTTSAAVNFEIDTTLPTLTITSPSEDAVGFSRSDVTVEWVGTDAGENIQGYEIWVDGIRTTTAAQSENRFTLNYTDGYHTVRIVAVDIAGSTAADEVTFLVDTIAPAIEAVQPEDGATMVPVDGSVLVTFNKEMDHGRTFVNMTGVTGTMEWNGSLLTFVPSTDLAYGASYTITVESRDLVGAPVTRTWTITTTDVGTVSGVVTDNNGNPLAGVTVSLDGQFSMVTGENGEFVFYPNAGAHNLTMSKPGWDGRTIPVSVQPGQMTGLGSIAVMPSNPLAIYGIIAALAGVAIVAVLIYFSHRRKKEKGPPARSWKGMNELQKRASRNKRQEEDEEEDLL